MMAPALRLEGAPVPRPETDYGNAERLVDRHGDVLRYVATWKRWYVWDGRRWARDETGLVVQYAKATVRAMMDEALALESSAAREALAKHALRSEHGPRLREMVRLAESEPAIAVRHDQLDADPWRLTVLNGTVDLRTGVLAPHDPSALLTRLTPVVYDAAARCPRWIAFLDRVLGSDAELMAFVQRAVGYSLTGLTGEQCLFFLHGAGANGKSTFLDTIRSLVGEQAAQADFASFLERKHADGPRNDIARLAGARLVTSSEVGEGKRLDESVVKTLTGGDVISARFLYAEDFEFRPQFKLWLAANHRPVIRGTDDAIWRRIRLIPFTVQIPAEDRDPGLADALAAERAGILQWAIAGCLAWVRYGLGIPPCVADATASYRAESDVLGAFLADCCDVGADLATPSGALYEAYRRWAERSGEHAVTSTAFGRLLTDRQFGQDLCGPKRVRHRTGLALRPEFDPTASPPILRSLSGSEQVRAG